MATFVALAAALLIIPLAGADFGWECSPPDPEHGRHSPGAGVPLRGRRMLTDRMAVSEVLPYADFTRFPKALSCYQHENASTSVADVLRPILGLSPGVCGNSPGRIESIFQSSGAVLLRGLPLDNASALSRLLRDVNVTTMAYTGGVAPRGEVEKGVMQASVEPPNLVMEPHWEMSYAPQFPHVIFFFCNRRPAKDGEGLTPVADGRAVLRSLRELGIAQTFEERGVLYRFFYPSRHDNSSLFGAFVWEIAFRTESTEEVDAFLSKRQASFPSLQWRWLQAAPGEPLALEYTLRREAVLTHPKSLKEQVWFNQITSMHRSYFHSHPTFPDLLEEPVPFEGGAGERSVRRYPFDTAFGDGDEIPEETIRTIRQVYWNHTVTFQWEEGDLLILDNMVAAHGRMDYDSQQYEREMLVSIMQL